MTGFAKKTHKAPERLIRTRLLGGDGNMFRKISIDVHERAR